MPTDPWGNPVTQPFEFAIAAFPATYPLCIAGRSVGYVAAPTLNVPTAIRASTYVAQAAQGQRSLVSTSALDTAAGTGARSVTINYLNNAMQLKQDTVVLNGTVAVNTNAVDIEFIESLVVATSGTDLANDGTINLMTGVGGAGTVMSAIVALDNSTFYAHHYVPAGVSCYVNKHTGAATLAAGRTFLVRTGSPTVTGPTLQIGDIIIHLAGSTEDHDYETPLIVTGPDLIVMRENPTASAAGNLAYASFDWVQF
jgi:hypothetical protein